MTETTKNSGEKLSVTSTKTLTLKRGGVEQGVVRQSFSHGRSKSVVVEKVKRRTGGPGDARPEPAAPVERVAAPKRAVTTAKAPAAPAAAPRRSRRCFEAFRNRAAHTHGRGTKRAGSRARRRAPA